MTVRFVLLVASAVAFALACGGNDGSDEITVPYSVIEALDAYEFTSELDVESGTGDLQIHFEGALQAPDRIQGRLEAQGEFWDSLGLPAVLDLVVIRDQAWMRSDGGEWQDGGVPLLIFGYYGTPLWYTRAFEFESVRLPGGDTEEIDGIEARRVDVDKTTLVRLLQTTPFLQEGEQQEFDTEQIEGLLPDDIAFTAWLAEPDLRLVRITVSLSVDEKDAFEFLFERPFSIDLQMDITDPNADVQIEPPE